MSEVGDNVLRLLTAKRELSWQAFNKSAGYLLEKGLDLDGDLKWKRVRLVRTLECLGYLETDFSKSPAVVQVAPPCLVRLPLAGTPRSLFVGARNAGAVDELAEVAEQMANVNLTIAESSISLSPCRVLIEATEAEDLAEFALRTGIEYSEAPAAWVILSVAGRLDAYRANLRFEDVQQSSWPRKVFNHEFLGFTETAEASEGLIALTNPVNNQPIHLYRKNGVEAVVDRDWGRYLVLQDARVDVLKYDSRKCLLVVPVSVPLPNPYAKALALCSGFDPYRGMSSRLMLYRYVPDVVANLLAQKLGQRLVADSLEFDEEDER